MKELPPYSIFAQVYDQLMKHVNYKFWSDYILSSFPSKNINSVLDLACGTGELLSNFPSHWKKVGIDKSDSMLEIAKQKNPDSEFIKADISNFSLSEKFDLILCTHDSANYLLTSEELKKLFLCVKQHLNSEGYFFFDLNSEYNLKYVFHKKIIQRVIKNIFIEWTNEYNEREKIIYSYLTFSQNGNIYSEKHLQKYHSIPEVVQLLNEVNFELLKIGSDYETWEITPQTFLFTLLTTQKRKLK